MKGFSMSKKIRMYTPNVSNGVQGSRVDKTVESVEQQSAAMALNFAPAAPEKYIPVKFIVVGNYQCPVKGTRSVQGKQECGFMYTSDSKELTDWLDSKGFKRV
jgi:hypothetical protein